MQQFKAFSLEQAISNNTLLPLNPLAVFFDISKLKQTKPNEAYVDFNNELSLEAITYPKNTQALQGTQATIKLEYQKLKEYLYKDTKDKSLIFFVLCPIKQDKTLSLEQAQSPSLNYEQSYIEFNFSLPLSLKFNYKELKVLEWGEEKESFSIQAFNTINLKEQSYKVKMQDFLLVFMPNEYYEFKIYNTNNTHLATLTNKQMQNIININNFIHLDDNTCDLASTLRTYTTKYGLDEVRFEVVGEEEDLPWLVIARREEGVLENTSNTEHNPRIIEYHSTTGKFQDDETPWCSSFVNWVITQAGLKGTNIARAASWKHWGQKLDKPAYGCIGVKIRANGTGHVGFIVGKTKKGKLVSLGGNQNDSVSYSDEISFQFFVYPLGYTPDYNLPEVDDRIIKKGGKTQ